MAKMILEMVVLIVNDVMEWFEGRESVYDYSEFAKRAGGKFESELLLERERNKLKGIKDKSH